MMFARIIYHAQWQYPETCLAAPYSVPPMPEAMQTLVCMVSQIDKHGCGLINSAAYLKHRSLLEALHKCNYTPSSLESNLLGSLVHIGSYGTAGNQTENCSQESTCGQDRSNTFCDPRQKAVLRLYLMLWSSTGVVIGEGLTFQLPERQGCGMKYPFSPLGWLQGMFPPLRSTGVAQRATVAEGRGSLRTTIIEIYQLGYVGWLGLMQSFPYRVLCQGEVGRIPRLGKRANT